MTVVTGMHCGENEHSPELYRCGIANTLVVLMVLTTLRSIAAAVISSGRSPETPAAVVSWGTYESQEVVKGTLGTIADAVERARLHAPALIVIGDVVRLRDELKWFESSGLLSYLEECELESCLG